MPPCRRRRCALLLLVSVARHTSAASAALPHPAVEAAAAAAGAGPGDVAIYRNGNLTGEAPMVLRAKDRGGWRRLEQSAFKLYDPHGGLLAGKAAAKEARLAFAADLQREHWIMPGIAAGFVRTLSLPTRHAGPGPRAEPPALAEPVSSSSLSAEPYTKQALAAKNAKQLKALLKENGLDIKGSKNTLVERLLAAGAAPQPAQRDPEEDSDCDASAGSSLFEVETLSDRPRVFRVRGFLSDTEANHLKELATPSLQRSSITSAANGKGADAFNAKDDVMRNSDTAWLPPRFGSWAASPEWPTGAADSVLQGIVDRSSAVLDMPP